MNKKNISKAASNLAKKSHPRTKEFYLKLSKAGVEARKSKQNKDKTLGDN